MKDGKKKPWMVALLVALTIGVEAFDHTREAWVILAFVAVVFLIGFGYMLVQGVREWKKPDEAILNEYTALFQFPKGKGAKKLNARYYLAAIALCLLACFGTGRMPAGARVVICALALLCVAIPILVGRLHGEPDKADKKEPWVRMIRQEAWVAIAIGIPANGFFLFCAGVGTYHGVWWFVVPLAAIFMLHFLRGPVAGIRHIQRTRRGIDTEPWEKKDRILK